jgi:hypothetical protein
MNSRIKMGVLLVSMVSASELLCKERIHRDKTMGDNNPSQTS